MSQGATLERKIQESLGCGRYWNDEELQDDWFSQTSG